jgi:hypothetical protein
VAAEDAATAAGAAVDLVAAEAEEDSVASEEVRRAVAVQAAAGRNFTTEALRQSSKIITSPTPRLASA